MAAFRAVAVCWHSELSMKNPAKQTIFSIFESVGPVISSMILLNAVTVSKQLLPPEDANARSSSDPSAVHDTVPCENLLSQSIKTSFKWSLSVSHPAPPMKKLPNLGMHSRLPVYIVVVVVVVSVAVVIVVVVVVSAVVVVCGSVVVASVVLSPVVVCGSVVVASVVLASVKLPLVVAAGRVAVVVVVCGSVVVVSAKVVATVSVVDVVLVEVVVVAWQV
jgi:hypothetical protein